MSDERALSPWVVDEWPDEATAAEVVEAQDALVGEADADADQVLAHVMSASARSVRRWRRNGVDGRPAKLIHAVLFFAEVSVNN